MDVLADTNAVQIIATRPRGARRGSSRRGTAKSQVLGTSNSPVTRSRAAPPATGAKSAAAPQPSEKIIVSNLPIDVNEAQIKVRFSAVVHCWRDTHTYAFVGTFHDNGRPSPGGYPSLRQQGRVKRCCLCSIPAQGRWHQGIPAIQQSPH